MFPRSLARTTPLQGSRMSSNLTKRCREPRPAPMSSFRLARSWFMPRFCRVILITWLAATSGIAASSGRNLRGYDTLGPLDYGMIRDSGETQRAVQDFVMKHWIERRRGHVIFTTPIGGGDVINTELFVEPAGDGSWHVCGTQSGALSDRFGRKTEKPPKLPVAKTFKAISVTWAWDLSRGSVLLLKDKEGNVVAVM